MVASLSSGLGEITFLALSSFYPSATGVMAFSAGTGAAGVTGSLAYLALHTWGKLSTVHTLMTVSIVPWFMLVSWWIISKPFEQIERSRLRFAPSPAPLSSPVDVYRDASAVSSPSDANALDHRVGSLADDVLTEQDPSCDLSNRTLKRPEQMSLGQRLQLLKPLIWPFMIPLFSVFWAYSSFFLEQPHTRSLHFISEYTINQGVFPTLIFEPLQWPVQSADAYYIYYQFCYQIAVFISRTSVRWIQFRQVYLMAIIQVGLLALFICQGNLKATVIVCFFSAEWYPRFDNVHTKCVHNRAPHSRRGAFGWRRVRECVLHDSEYE